MALLGIERREGGIVRTFREVVPPVSILENSPRELVGDIRIRLEGDLCVFHPGIPSVRKKILPFQVIEVFELIRIRARVDVSYGDQHNVSFPIDCRLTRTNLPRTLRLPL